jgi:hypothetical protein
MKYWMAPIWLASFLENASVSRTKRETRCRKVLLKRSMWIGFPGFLRNRLVL